MKNLIFILLGIIIVTCCGFTYRAGRGICKHEIDVRIVEVGEHEYVIASSSTGCTDGGVAVSMLHHVGCKKCKEK